ncbi:hypothetical protein [Kitasatospora cineracea]|uniref:Uncharacterized protein n=1 Tax=Kitasatospora cineracea TaxID=88074 RepID=A0A3N4RNP5_9ACTN|nr:hypothetical protein [Kitasatospora cineracea]RPE34973.1 hypothetical protein EDD38_3317 [Kitasatospora cineracea]
MSAAALPVRLPLAGEIALMGRFMDDHGDPSEWSQDTALEYAAAVATLRAEEINSWTRVAR